MPEVKFAFIEGWTLPAASFRSQGLRVAMAGAAGAPRIFARTCERRTSAPLRWKKLWGGRRDGDTGEASNELKVWGICGDLEMFTKFR